jgi:hypothetical protein
VHSSLADGADRLVVRRALVRSDANGFIAFLPVLSGKQYEDNFVSDRSREEFAQLVRRARLVIPITPAEGEDTSEPNAGDPSPHYPDGEAYAAVNREMLREARALIAVWDGKPPQGGGGTGDMVAKARARGLPLAWVHAGNRRPGTEEPTSLGPEQGTVTFEGF